MLKKLLIFFIFSFFSSHLFSAQKINGAGATFPYPLYSKWFSEYQKTHTNVQFNYQSIGSGGGVKQVLAQTVDFGASDAPMSDAELKSAKISIRHIPMILGAVTVTYNIKGISSGLKLDGQTLANIFQGKINKWNDPTILKLNPEIKLPDSEILVVRRSDGSGTTSIFSTFLAELSSEWKEKIGAGKNINWPTGIGAKGNEGVTAMVAQTEGAVGYVELAYAINSKLSMASIKNKNGDFVLPSVESISNSAAFIKELTSDLRISVLNADGKNVYPISSFTWILLPEDDKSPAIKEVRAFLRWALKDGQAFAKNLHYAPLPKKIAEAILATTK